MTTALEQRLRAMAAELTEGRTLSLGDVAEAHGQAAHGAMLVLLAAPCLLPVPGTGTVLSLGLTALALVIWQGKPEVALPQRVAGFTLSAPSARRLLGFLVWLYTLAARLARCRWEALTGQHHRHWMSGLVATMAFLIFLPIPLGNVLPATALVCLGLGLAFRDGWAVLLALGAASLAVATSLGLLWWTWQLGAQLA